MTLIGTFNPPAFQVEDLDTFEFCGESFTVAPQTALPMTRFAWDSRRIEKASSDVSHSIARLDARIQLADANGDADAAASASATRDAAQAKLSTLELEAMAAIHQALMDSIGVEEWPRFQDLALRHRVDIAFLMTVVNRLLEAVTERPTESSTASSPGPSTNGTGSQGGSISREAHLGLTTAAAAPTLTDAERQRLEIIATSRPVIRSGG